MKLCDRKDLGRPHIIIPGRPILSQDENGSVFTRSLKSSRKENREDKTRDPQVTEAKDGAEVCVGASQRSPCHEAQRTIKKKIMKWSEKISIAC